MQTKKLMKLVFLVTIIMGIVINACKKNDCPTAEPTPTPIAGTCPTKDTAYMNFNGAAFVSTILLKLQTATQISVTNATCGGVLPGISCVINKAGLVEGQTYDQTIFASFSIFHPSGRYAVSTAQIKVLTYTANCLKINYSMSLVGTNGTTGTATVTGGVLELLLP
jgi:hypothetical protein